MNNNSGTFVISLDFELIWGVLDSRNEAYFERLLGVHNVVPMLLDLFTEYDTSCTWATVGALLVDNMDDFNHNIPTSLPNYNNFELNPYISKEYIYSLDSKLYSAPDLVRDIILTPKQELASHTFSHYYCLEPGQQIDNFSSDLAANLKLAKREGVSLKSIVFPRNQFNSSYLNVLSSMGFTSFRGNPNHWAYEAAKGDEQDKFKRIFRLIDNYIPLSGSLTSTPTKCEQSGLVNIPASLFLRPYNPRLKWLDGLRLLRIKRSMTDAAQKGKLFHLWWHPHNFGSYVEENIKFLEDILQHYCHLKDEYGFESLTMSEVAMRSKQ